VIGCGSCSNSTKASPVAPAAGTIQTSTKFPTTPTAMTSKTSAAGQPLAPAARASGTDPSTVGCRCDFGPSHGGEGPLVVLCAVLALAIARRRHIRTQVRDTSR
jgi:hypothetical protein